MNKLLLIIITLILLYILRLILPKSGSDYDETDYDYDYTDYDGNIFNDIFDFFDGDNDDDLDFDD